MSRQTVRQRFCGKNTLFCFIKFFLSDNKNNYTPKIESEILNAHYFGLDRVGVNFFAVKSLLKWKNLEVRLRFCQFNNS